MENNGSLDNAINFKLKYRDPLKAGHKVFKKTQFQIRPGITVLTGCNGSGKTTLIRFLLEEFERLNMLYFHYNNLTDSRHTNFRLTKSDQDLMMLRTFVSEGENISINVKGIINSIKYFLNELKDGSPMTQHFKYPGKAYDKSESKKYDHNKIWILFDATDSGYSIDNVIDMKKGIHEIKDYMLSNNITPYIIISANEYEMCRGEQCLNVQNLEYETYSDYDAYKNAILASRKYKDKEVEKGFAKYDPDGYAEYIKSKQNKD